MDAVPHRDILQNPPQCGVVDGEQRYLILIRGQRPIRTSAESMQDDGQNAWNGTCLECKAE